MDIKEFERLKSKYESAKLEQAKTNAVLESVKERLQADFNCSSIEEAEKELASLKEKAESTEKEMENLFNELKQAMEGV